jgi:DNA repair protein RecO (recombination protein O)
MFKKTNAIVVKSLKYGESSLIVNCYCENFGLQAFILRGILKSKSEKAPKKSVFEPLNIIEIIFSKKESNNIGYIKEAKVKFPYKNIPFNFDKKSTIFFLNELLYQVLQEDKSKNINLFMYLYNSLIWLDSSKKISNFLIKFMFDLTKFIGFQPNVENEKFSYFDLENGFTTNTKPKGKFIEGKLKNIMILFLGTTFDKISSIKLNKIERIKLFNYALYYFQCHLQKFNKPKSISILNEIYSPI